MATRDEHDLVAHAHRLADADDTDGFVYKLGQYVDWDEAVITRAMDKLYTQETFADGGFIRWSTSKSKGIHVALEMARNQARQREYRRAHPIAMRSSAISTQGPGEIVHPDGSVEITHIGES